jgi:RNA polymerase sigma factor (sigma-70 family)
LDPSRFDLHAPLVARCLSGDRQAHYELYQTYSKAMLNTCFRMVNDRDAAEDILQEAFISAFKNLASYRGDATFGAWLKRIVINKAVNFLNKQRLEREFLSAEQDRMEEAVPAEFQWETVDNLELSRIRAAVNRLPDGYRLVFSLYLLEGYDHEEISEIMGISVSTSKSQLNRAKRKLLEILKSEVPYEKRA